MSKMPPKVDSLEMYMRKLSAIVRDVPALAPLAYQRAANHVRSLVSRPENRGRNLEIQAIANQLDLLAAEAIVPETDAIDAEVISPFSDDPAGEIPTEWDGVLADHAQAQVNPSGGPASQLAASAAFERFQKERAHELVTPVQITPESAGNSGNQLSDTVLVRFGGSSGSGSFVQSGGISGPVVAKEETEIIRWDGRECEPFPCTIAISPLEGGANANYPTGGTTTTSYSYRPYFRAFWGSGSRGRANEVYGDVGRGVQFTVSASHVYVNVGMDSFSATVAVGPSVTYEAGAMYLTGNLGFFSGNSQTPVTRTRYIDEIADDATSTIVVPFFAKSLLPVQCTNTAGTTQLDFRDANNNTLYSLLYVNGTLVSPIPIADDVHQIRLTNASGGTAGYRLIFELAL